MDATPAHESILWKLLVYDIEFYTGSKNKTNKK